MHLISIRAAGRTLGRFVFASAVRIALSATLTTPQPTVALQAVVDTSGPLTGPAAFVRASREQGQRRGARQSSHDAGFCGSSTWTRMRPTTGRTVGKIAMCFLIATLALVIALFAGALVAPSTGKYPGLRIDPCVLETGGWSMTDPACSEMQIEIMSRTTALSTGFARPRRLIF
jgi:hypothetical protein